MTKTKNKSLALGLAALLTAGVAGAAFTGFSKAVTASAELDTTKVTYPFETGENAFQYAPSFTMGTDEDSKKPDGSDGWLDKWEFVEVRFDKTTDLRNAKYLAVQMRVDAGSPGLTCGLLEGGDRFYYDDNGGKYDKPVYYVSENGTIRESNIMYNANDPGRGFCGMVLIPMDSLTWQWNNEQSDLSKVRAFYWTTNTMFNRNYQLTIGEIGYYNGEIGDEGTSFNKLVDLSKGERAESMYYVDSAHSGCLSFPSFSARPVIPYAFAEKEEAWKNTVNWTPTEANQTLTATFDSATDFSNATHLLVQYYSNESTGLKFALSDGTKNRELAANVNTFFIPQGTDVGNLINTTDENGAITILGARPQAVGHGKGVMGMIVIPIKGGMAGDAELAQITSLIITTTGATDVVIGAIGYYAGSSKTVLELSENVLDKYTASAENTLVKYVKPEREMISATVTKDVSFADRDIDQTFTKEQQIEVNESNDTKEEYYNNGGLFEAQGSIGSVKTNVTDSYGEKALQVIATGNVGDSYTAPEFGVNGFNWYGYKGISFWARNDSNKEVSFNIEINCSAPVIQKDGTKQWTFDRFNIPQGKRYYLYDVNTGKTTIYMSRPTATLPVGFEGWVWIPFTAFARAEWSNNGVTVEQIYNNEYSVIERLGVSIKADQWGNMPFSINNFGAYKQTPQFESVYVNANGNTIANLLGLNKEEN